jgi:hypothetical protein
VLIQMAIRLNHNVFLFPKQVAQPLGQFAHIGEHQALTGAGGRHEDLARVRVDQRLALVVPQAQGLLLLEQRPQADQKDDRGFQAGAGVEGGDAHVVPRVGGAGLHGRAASHPAVDGRDQRPHALGVGVQHIDILAREAVRQKGRHLVGHPGDLVLGAGQGDDVRRGTRGHIEQVGDQHVVVLFVRQALAVKQRRKAHDLARRAVAFAQQDGAAAGFHAHRLPGGAAAQEALGGVRHQEQVGGARLEGALDQVDPQRGEELGLVDQDGVIAGQVDLARRGPAPQRLGDIGPIAGALRGQLGLVGLIGAPQAGPLVGGQSEAAAAPVGCQVIGFVHRGLVLDPVDLPRQHMGGDGAISQVFAPGGRDEGRADHDREGLDPGLVGRPDGITPGEEGVPVDLLGRRSLQAVEAAFQVVAQGLVVGQDQETLAGVEVMEQPQPVEQDQRLAAAGHAVDDVELEVIRQLGALRIQLEVGFQRAFLVVIEEEIGQPGGDALRLGRAGGQVGGHDGLGRKAAAEDRQAGLIQGGFRQEGAQDRPPSPARISAPAQGGSPGWGAGRAARRVSWGMRGKTTRDPS